MSADEVGLDEVSVDEAWVVERLLALSGRAGTAPGPLDGFVNAECLVGTHGAAAHLTIRAGRVVAAEPGPVLMRAWDFAYRAPPEAWRAHWRALPAPGFHDLLAMTKSGVARAEGDLRSFLTNLQFFKDLLATPRDADPDARCPGDGGAEAAGATGFEPIVGRYLRLAISGVAHRVYVEEAGSGIPLVLLHTAGSDGRQWRHLLNDEAVTRDFRVIAFDLPFHGKSNPPDAWQGEEYRLTTASYTAAIRAVCAAMELDRPVVMGCSIGGRIVLNLAIAHAREFRALIGLEAADHQQPWYDTAWLNRPDVHGAEICAALVSGLIAPGGPAARRRETLWHYKQGGPGIFKGDLYFYRVDGDLRGRTAGIDAAACPLFLLTGEYDYSCSPADTRRTAATIPGAEVGIMDRLGHFPMSEDPERFRAHVLPVLERIKAL